MQKLGIRGLVSIGGDGSLSIGQQLFEGGVPLVGVPKTIDNDLEGTVMTFGFDSAVACATDALDRLHTTAESHNRVMVLEVMGRYAGWIALYAGVAGGADVILIPEIPFTYDSICDKIQEREKADKHFTLVIVAEGAGRRGASLSRPPTRLPTARPDWAALPAVVATEIEKRTGKEARAVRPRSLAARRQPYELRPRAVLDLRRRSRGTDCRRQVWADGGLPGLPGGRGEDHRSHRAIEDRAAHRRLCPHSPGIRNFP